jgi:hypothetical protein
LAGPWTINRDRRNGEVGELRAVLSQVGSWSRRMLFTRPASARRARVRRGVTLGRRTATIPSDRQVSGTVRTIRTRRAVLLLAIMTIAAVLLTWATVSLARRGIASSEAVVKTSAGPLINPAPRIAGGLPRRFSSISQEGAGPIVAALRQRFGAVGAGLIADARMAEAAAGTQGAGSSGSSQAGVAAAANGATVRPVTAAWPSGLYAQPGHIDPVTGRAAWVMYLGLDATAKIGIPRDVIARLMMGILGRYSKVGPWPVAAGHRGGSANCTVAWLARTQVAVCGWASDHSIGVLASPTRNTNVAELAALMIKMRFDLQKQ